MKNPIVVLISQFISHVIGKSMLKQKDLAKIN